MEQKKINIKDVNYLEYNSDMIFGTDFLHGNIDSSYRQKLIERLNSIREKEEQDSDKEDE